MVSLREMARADAERVPPVWLLPLLEAMFFVPCPQHPEASRATRSGGCNMSCIDCTGRTLCHACIAADHAGRRPRWPPSNPVCMQVRKSSGHNVVKVKDVEALLNVDGVQPYLINSEDAVFLNPRPQSGNGRPGEHRCKDRDCDRALVDGAYHFCSLRCKLECMEWDLDVSFAVQPETESESTEDNTETDDDDASPRSSKRLRNAASSMAGKGNCTGEYGAATTASQQATPASNNNPPSSPGRQ
ncbi:hypothetical protein QOZ80_2BG0157470 [Eleusine coracana subsp. coracana]|nr:hypothetical protein QOZ80_2BG0157470 [Eleusine coracana subsp. coracana]